MLIKSEVLMRNANFKRVLTHHTTTKPGLGRIMPELMEGRNLTTFTKTKFSMITPQVNTHLLELKPGVGWCGFGELCGGGFIVVG